MKTSNMLAKYACVLEKVIFYTRPNCVPCFVIHVDSGLKNRFQLPCQRLDLAVFVVDVDFRSLCQVGAMAST